MGWGGVVISPATVCGCVSVGTMAQGSLQASSLALEWSPAGFSANRRITEPPTSSQPTVSRCAVPGGRPLFFLALFHAVALRPNSETTLPLQRRLAGVRTPWLHRCHACWWWRGPFIQTLLLLRLGLIIALLAYADCLDPSCTHSTGRILLAALTRAHTSGSSHAGAYFWQHSRGRICILLVTHCLCRGPLRPGWPHHHCPGESPQQAGGWAAPSVYCL